MRRFKFVRDPQPEELGNNVTEFLRWMAGPSCFLLAGEDGSRTRALVTLLHGNEPSGTIALHRYLRSGRRPAVNVVCVVASVGAALEQPLFSHRMLPRARDLNRCFRPPFDDAQGVLAEEILEILRLHAPEAVIDMHNTSGSGPAFGVCTFMDRNHEALVSLFTQRLIISSLGLGALMEISEDNCPTVTVEVGGRLDEQAHELAFEGLCRFFEAPDVLRPGDTDWGLELLRDPIRLELKDNVTLTYAEEPCANYDITLRPDIEHHNFGAVDTDTVLGWARADAPQLFSAQDAGGHCAVSRLVRIAGGRLYPAQPLKLFMITNNAAIAHSDCLFYAVADDGSTICT
ncbi:succinylglutamate desuccinylase [Seongchinamella sediminis]|uniref:Succinylglutamate desuccinylase n=1 Tax=Seongchinamella sediminis TaxID=2283635 RepID=A0A3L7E347_9GAMM|nr:succinylglutamate desuccinylase/aspartoacylase family protein [Seongchinamella sediminis]RLQ22801.1 succinylglutamate desuccinylase [Seongchinamella sediminis]